MRIASYNVMSGGFDGYDLMATQPPRLPELKAAVQEIGADVVGLIDTFRWDNLFSTEELCKFFGYKYAFCINLNDDRLRRTGHNNGLALLSNVPITDVRTVRISTRDALAARLPGKLTLVLAYLDDLSEDTRLMQVNPLSSLLNTKEPTILMGDLNTISKDDVSGVREALVGFYAKNPGLEDKLGSIIADMQRGEVVSLLESLGLQDADTTNAPTVPTKLFSAKSDEPFLRLDYCLHSRSVTVTNFTVPTQDIFHKASDHFPIVFDVEIK
jgi:endonuclease/exonuclease/phosphatase family metal-dependent hydrolase